MKSAQGSDAPKTLRLEETADSALDIGFLVERPMFVRVVFYRSEEARAGRRIARPGSGIYPVKGGIVVVEPDAGTPALAVPSPLPGRLFG